MTDQKLIAIRPPAALVVAMALAAAPHGSPHETPTIIRAQFTAGRPGLALPEKVAADGA